MPRSEDDFMQSSFWADFKTRTGWKAYRFQGGLAGGASGSQASARDIFVLVRPLGLGFSFAYLPHAPGKPEYGEDPATSLESLARAVAKKVGGRLLFVRFDLSWDRDDSTSQLLLDSAGRGLGKLKRGTAVQVPDTVILDIDKPEEEILAGMKPKWRYNIKLADKKNVEVRREGEEALETFYALYLETAKRDGIAIHPLSYYRALFQTQETSREGRGEPAPSLSIWIARHEEKPIASIITLFYGGQATYLYGASSGEKRNLMPAYALQWRAIEAAKAEGCVEYDFFGIPPNDDPNHPMAGLYLFKTGFGGTIVHRVGCVDYPVAPLAYSLFRAAESLRLIWFKKIKKAFRTAARKS